jgi:hypothetical protein
MGVKIGRQTQRFKMTASKLASRRGKKPFRRFAAPASDDLR